MRQQKLGFFARLKLEFKTLLFTPSRVIGVMFAQVYYSPLIVSQLLGKSLRVDHVSNYKVPKDHEDYDDVTRRLHDEGCAPILQLPTAAIKREEFRRPAKVEKSPTSPADVRRVKRERDSTTHDEKVCNLSVARACAYHIQN